MIQIFKFYWFVCVVTVYQCDLLVGFPNMPCTFEDPSTCPFSIDCPQKPSSFSWKLSKSMVTYSRPGKKMNWKLNGNRDMYNPKKKI